MDDETKCVTVSDWRAASTQKACWRGSRTGCHLILPDTAQFPVPSVLLDVDTLNNAPPAMQPTDPRPWPLGENEDADPAAVAAAKANVDMEAIDKVVTAHFGRDELHARGFLLLHKGQIIYEK